MTTLRSGISRQRLDRILWAIAGSVVIAVTTVGLGSGAIAADATKIDRSKLKIHNYVTGKDLDEKGRKSDEVVIALGNSVPDLPLELSEVRVKTPDGKDIRIGNVTFDGDGNLVTDGYGYLYEGGVPRDINTIVVADRSGNFVRSFAPGALYVYPHSIRRDSSGNIWSVDAHMSVIYKFSPHGKLLSEISVGERPYPDVLNTGTTDVAVAPSGEIYISDGYGNRRVLQYSPDGARVRSWGKEGRAAGEFVDPHGIAAGLDGTIYVADRANGRLQWFAPDGKFLGEFVFGGWVMSVRVAPKSGDVYVAARAIGPDPTTEFDKFMATSYIFKMDPKTKQIVGKVNYPLHQFDVAEDGAIVVGAPRRRSGEKVLSTFVLFKPKTG